MANAKKCDKCGAFYTHNVGFFKKGRALASIRLYDSKDFSMADYDLCDDCATELGFWLDNLTRVVEDES